MRNKSKLMLSRAICALKVLLLCGALLAVPLCIVWAVLGDFAPYLLGHIRLFAILVALPVGYVVRQEIKDKQ